MLNWQFEPVRRRDKANTRHTIVEEEEKELKILHFQRGKKEEEYGIIMNVVCVQERLSRQKKKSPLSNARVDNGETERKLWMSEWLSFPVYMSRRTVHKEGKQTRFYKPSLWIWPRVDEEVSSPFGKFSFRFNSEIRSECAEVPDVSSPCLSWYASSAHSVDRSAPVASSRVNAFSIERLALERRRTFKKIPEQKDPAFYLFIAWFVAIFSRSDVRCFHS